MLCTVLEEGKSCKEINKKKSFKVKLKTTLYDGQGGEKKERKVSYDFLYCFSLNMKAVFPKEKLSFSRANKY